MLAQKQPCFAGSAMELLDLLPLLGELLGPVECWRLRGLKSEAALAVRRAWAELRSVWAAPTTPLEEAAL